MQHRGHIRSGLIGTLLVGSLLAGCAADAEVSVTDRTAPSSTARPTTSTTSTASPTVATSTTEGPGPAAVTTTRPPSPPVTAEPQVRPFSASIKTVTARDLYASWRPGCPLPVDQLRALDVTHFGTDGAVHTGRMIVAANLANETVEILRDLYDARFPIERMEPIDVYGGDDNKSIKANNTSGFNCRAVTGGGGWSEHAYGRAIDINPFVNPYVKGSTVLPPESAPYTDRSRQDPGMIHGGDAVVAAFEARGWVWGGDWSSLKDYQHFSTTGR